MLCVNPSQARFQDLFVWSTGVRVGKAGRYYTPDAPWDGNIYQAISPWMWPFFTLCRQIIHTWSIWVLLTSVRGVEFEHWTLNHNPETLVFAVCFNRHIYVLIISYNYIIICGEKPKHHKAYMYSIQSDYVYFILFWCICCTCILLSAYWNVTTPAFIQQSGNQGLTPIIPVKDSARTCDISHVIFPTNLSKCSCRVSPTWKIVMDFSFQNLA